VRSHSTLKDELHRELKNARVGGGCKLAEAASVHNVSDGGRVWIGRTESRHVEVHVIGQIAFQSRTLLAGSIEQEHSWRPDRIEAVEPCRVLFDMGFYRKEVFADELGSFLIFIRFGIQPSACSSSRSRAEIQQDGAGLLLGCGQSLIDILAPIHAHDSALYEYGATA